MDLSLLGLRLLALTLWVGGLCFFAFILAPIAFGSLPDPHSAGVVVGGTLRVLHWLGLTTAVIFAGATLAWSRRGRLAPKLLRGEMLAVGLMFALTAYSQFGIIPRMETARTQAGPETLSTGLSQAARTFQRLHVRSERVEGTVLLLGLALVAMMAWEHAYATGRPRQIT